MKITDKQMLDWLQKNYIDTIYNSAGWYCCPNSITPFKLSYLRAKTLRSAIKKAMKDEGKKRMG